VRVGRAPSAASAAAGRWVALQPSAGELGDARARGHLQRDRARRRRFSRPGTLL
jgi:hypothetical protein